VEHQDRPRECDVVLSVKVPQPRDRMTLKVATPTDRLTGQRPRSFRQGR